MPKGRLFPQTRDELLECVALLESVDKKKLDRVIIPEAPVDILAQQVVAEVACQEATVDELLAMAQHAYPYRNLGRENLLSIIDMLASGFATRRGRRGDQTDSTADRYRAACHQHR